MNNADEFIDRIMGIAGLDKTPYYCVKCGHKLDVIPVKTMIETPRKIFYCRNKQCIHYGLTTVVAIKG